MLKKQIKFFIRFSSCSYLPDVDKTVCQIKTQYLIKKLNGACTHLDGCTILCQKCRNIMTDVDTWGHGYPAYSSQCFYGFGFNMIE